MTHDYYNIGNVFYYLGNYQEALEYYHKARAIREELGDKVGLTKNYTNIGIVLSNLGNYQEALEYHNKAIESGPNTLTIDANYAIALYNRACPRVRIGKIDDGLSDLKRAIKLNKKRYIKLANNDSNFENIRHDKRFKSLLK